MWEKYTHLVRNLRGALEHTLTSPQNFIIPYFICTKLSEIKSNSYGYFVSQFFNQMPFVWPTWYCISYMECPLPKRDICLTWFHTQELASPPILRWLAKWPLPKQMVLNMETSRVYSLTLCLHFTKVYGLVIPCSFEIDYWIVREVVYRVSPMWCLPLWYADFA